MAVAVTFLLRNGLFPAGRLEAVAGAIVLDLGGSIGPLAVEVHRV
jgi:hypothetical protein